MPRYYFNISNGERDLDPEGTDLPDFATARREAVRFAGAVLSEDRMSCEPFDTWRLQVTDVDGVTLLSFDVRVTTSPHPIAQS